MKKVITSVDYVNKYKGHDTGSDTLTVPNQSMTVAEIVRRYASGQPVMGGRDKFYGGENLEDEDITQQKNFDEFDAQEALESIHGKLSKAKRAEEEKKAKQQAAERKAQESSVAERQSSSSEAGAAISSASEPAS